MSTESDEIRQKLDECMKESYTLTPLRSVKKLYTLNYLLPNIDNKAATLFRDSPTSKSMLNKALERAEKICILHENAKVWLTEWNDKTSCDTKIIQIPESWDDQLKAHSENIIADQGSVIVDADINYVNNEIDIFQQFIEFVKKNLGLNEVPPVHVIAKRDGSLQTYGAFDPNTGNIVVFGKNRGFADVLRTSAHELTHHKQKVSGKIPANLKGRNGDLEAEANSVAGDMVYMFGLQHPEIYNYFTTDSMNNDSEENNK